MPTKRAAASADQAAPPRQIRVRNRRLQPIELHLGGRVVVLPPLGSVVIDERDAHEPHVERLLQARDLAIAPEPAPQAEQGESGAQAPPDDARTRRRERPARRAGRPAATSNGRP